MSGIAAGPRTVLHVFSGDLWAGAEVMVYNLLSRLRHDRLVDVRAISLNDGVLVRKLREAGVRVDVIPESALTLPRIVLEARRLIRGNEIQVIHAHRYKENLIGLLLVRTLRIPRLVTTVHGLPELPRDHYGKPRRESLRTQGNFLLLRYGFTHVVAVCEDVRRTLVDRYGMRPERVSVIYNGIPLGEAVNRNWGSVRDGFRIGTVGRLVPVKGFDLVLSLAAELRHRLSAIRWSILGEGPLDAALRERARSLGVADIVEFLPSRPDPRPYYESLDLYINTSLHEGIPLSVLEAMACGTPVVAARVGGIPEILTHGCEGLLVGERSAAAFADACEGLLRDEALRVRMAEAARKRVIDAFSDQRMAERYLALYQALDHPMGRSVPCPTSP